MQQGDKVKVKDFSMAHDDTGTILFIQSDGIIIVELDADDEKCIEVGTCWPIMNENELELIHR